MTSSAAVRDESLVARVTRRTELLYEDGGDPSSDRPGHVRAGSGLTWLGEHLVVAQDDASFLAILDVAKGTASAVRLEHVVLGRRVFEARLGNKKHKLDLEACARLPDGRVLVVGSGSLPIRERFVLVSPSGSVLVSPSGSILGSPSGSVVGSPSGSVVGSPSGSVVGSPSGSVVGSPSGSGPPAEIVDASLLFAALRERADFAGSEINIEGAAVLGDRLLLVNRGNGAARGGRTPRDAIADLSLVEVLAYLGGGGVPAIRDVRAYDLGSIAGVRLTFTDVHPRGASLAFLAAAEASPNAIDDGEVVGTAFGLIEAGTARVGTLLDEHGAPLRAKVEGLAWATRDGTGSRAYAVVDRDDPDLPTELLELDIKGL